MFLFTALLPITLGCVLGGDPCPPKEEVLPCTCNQIPIENNSPLAPSIPTVKSVEMVRRATEVETPQPQSLRNETFSTVVNCKLAKSLFALEEAVSVALHRKCIDKLVITNLPPKKEYTLARLPSVWLKEMRIKQFEIRDSVLAGDFIWKGNPFEGQYQSLVSFRVTHCFLSGALTYETPGTTNTKGLNYFSRLENVNFSHNHLVLIQATSFRHPPANLTTVILSHNSIQIIEPATFHYIPKLKHVDFSHNLLETVSRSIFASQAKELEHIDFSWNLFTSLSSDFFTNMLSLKVVNFRHNFLYALPANPWRTVWTKLNFVDVTGNFIECDCNLVWLLSTLPSALSNVTTIPPKDLPGQKIRGYCSQTQLPSGNAQKHHLVTLTRDKLVC